MLPSALILSCLSFWAWRVLLYGSQAQALCNRTKEVNKLQRREGMDSISISTQAQAFGAPRGMVEEGEKAHSKAAQSQISLQQHSRSHCISVCTEPPSTATLPSQRLALPPRRLQAHPRRSPCCPASPLVLKSHQTLPVSSLSHSAAKDMV
jgi:hypothetical protein